jgi:hypothetical protein
MVCKTKKISIYKTIVLPLVLYVRDKWSHTLKEEDKLQALLNKMLRKVLGPKKGKVSE